MHRRNTRYSATPRVASYPVAVAGARRMMLLASVPWAWPAEAAAYPLGSGSLGGRVVLLSHARGDAATIADRDALVLRPGPDVRATLTAGHRPPPPAPLPPARPAGVLDEG